VASMNPEAITAATGIPYSVIVSAANRPHARLDAERQASSRLPTAKRKLAVPMLVPVGRSWDHSCGACPCGHSWNHCRDRDTEPPQCPRLVRRVGRNWRSAHDHQCTGGLLEREQGCYGEMRYLGWPKACLADYNGPPSSTVRSPRSARSPDTRAISSPGRLLRVCTSHSRTMPLRSKRARLGPGRSVETAPG
jgi:hypothetical protein